MSWKDHLKEVDRDTRMCLLHLEKRINGLLMTRSQQPAPAPEQEKRIEELSKELKNLRALIKDRDEKMGLSYASLETAVNKFLEKVPSEYSSSFKTIPNKELIKSLRRGRLIFPKEVKPYWDMLLEITRAIWGEYWGERTENIEIIGNIWDLQDFTTAAEVYLSLRDFDKFAGQINFMEEQIKQIKFDWLKGETEIKAAILSKSLPYTSKGKLKEANP